MTYRLDTPNTMSEQPKSKTSAATNSSGQVTVVQACYP